MCNQTQIRRLNIIAEFSGFFTLCTVNHLSGGAKLLYLSLLNTCNRAGWPMWISVDRNRLCADMSVADVRAVNRARDELLQLGLITYKQGKKGKPSSYCLTQIEGNSKFGDFATPAKAQAQKKKVQEDQVQAQLVSTQIKDCYGSHGLVQLTKGERILLDSSLGKDLAMQTIYQMDLWLSEKGCDVLRDKHYNTLLQWGLKNNQKNPTHVNG